MPVRTNHLAPIGVVLLNWNGGEFTVPCIRSLLQAHLPPDRILVVDNASTDGSPELIGAQFPQVTIIKSETNLGFTGGNNVGIRHLLDEGMEFIWILNNDTIVEPTCLQELAGAMTSDPTIAAATGKILYMEPANWIWYAGADWQYWSLSAPHRGAREVDQGQFDEACDVGFASGCSLFVRRSTFEQIGLLDERYYIYNEDSEWCLRARAGGLRIRYVPQAVIRHLVSATFKKNTLGTSGGTASPLAHYLTTRNHIFTIRQYAHRPGQYFTAMAGVLLRRLYISAGLVLLKRWEKLMSVWRGVHDGLTTPL